MAIRPTTGSRTPASRRSPPLRILAAGAILAAATVPGWAADSREDRPPDATPVSVPAIDETTRIALEATPDGRDLRDEAWHRLVDHVRGWPRTSEAFATATVIRPRWSEVLADPDRFRGELLEASGRLEQQDPVRTPGVRDGGVLEWFIRTEDGAGGVVVQAFVPAEAVGGARTGRSVAVIGRLLRRTDLEGRDGTVRPFATIVGVPLSPIASGTTPSAGWIVGLATLALLPIALLLRRAARRARGRRPAIHRSEDEEVPRRHDLPEDPAEALDVLASERTIEETATTAPRHETRTDSGTPHA